MRKIVFTVALLITLISNLFAQDINVLEINNKKAIGKYVNYYIDTLEQYTSPTHIPAQQFNQSKNQILNFQFTGKPIWIKFSIQPLAADKTCYLRIINPNLDKVTLYYTDSTTEKLQQISIGETYPFNQRYFANEDLIFKLPHYSERSSTYYIKVQTLGQALIPMYLNCNESLITTITSRDIVNGIYIGIMLVMAIYNLFIFFVIKDKSYLLYVAYIICAVIIQCDAEGVCFRYLWPEYPFLNKPFHLLFPALIGIISLHFFYQFLNIKLVKPTIYKYIQAISALYILLFLLSFSAQYQNCYIAIQVLALVASIFVLYHSAQLAIKGNRTALFFIIAWGVFLMCVILFVLRNFNLLPYNTFTIKILEIGSAFEVVLLSFALADKINIYRLEKELSQLETIRVSEQNAKLIVEQNIFLEQKVEERTHQLKEVNQELEHTLSTLKEAQSQLVDSEKMASLGQLTAGIAHEINNPINFVTSNIKPLEMDIADLNELIDKYDEIQNPEEFEKIKPDIEKFKKEIDISFLKEEIKTLLSGIKEGAIRTAEIVRSLKTFSRLDETDMKLVNINEGLESTLVLIRNIMPKQLILIKELNDIPKIECLGGKMNQVFMNLITNAIQAIKMKKELNNEEYLTIKTFLKDEDYICISIKDSGVGVPEEIKNKIYEPFFSTKDIGEGTGLGLSIVRSIIESHHGKIDLYSEIGKGSEFVVTLPIKN